jgi:hypothetical protein
LYVCGIAENVKLDSPPAAVTLAIDSYAPTAAKVNELDALETAEPVELEAVTVKVYATPEERPLTVIGLEPVPVKEPGVEVAVKVVAVPPLTAAV